MSWASRISLWVLLLLMIAQVVARYFFNQPFSEVLVLTEAFLMPALVFFSLATVQRHDEHVRVDLVYMHFRGPVKQLADVLICGISAIYWALIAIGGTQEALFSWQMGYEISKDFPLPIATALAIVPIGAAILSLRLVVDVLKATAALAAPTTAERP